MHHDPIGHLDRRRLLAASNGTDTEARGRCRNQAGDTKGHAMLRHVTIGLAVATLVGATLIPDEGLARGRGGGGARVGAVGGGARIAGNRAHVSHPIARNGMAWRGNAWRGVGVGVGAAAVGAAAAGYYGNYGYSDGYYNNCYRDAYGQLICPNQYQNQYQYRY
jgi:hypothetical protein